VDDFTEPNPPIVMKRHATAVWDGTLETGGGHLSTQSGALDNAPYDAPSRFAQGEKTNPEELIAAAHAGCFAMALAHKLEDNGFPAESVEAKAVVNLDPEQLEIIESRLECRASVPKIQPDKFQQVADEAKVECPVSKTLQAAIELQAELIPAGDEGQSSSAAKGGVQDQSAEERAEEKGYV